jgi:hypothetical protein
MNIDHNLQVGAMLVQSRAKDVIGDREVELEERARICFEACLDEGVDWFSTTEDQRFRIGVAALHLLSNEEEKARIETTLRGLRALSAAMSGVPVNFGALTDDPEKLVPLMPWFREVKDKKEARR